MEKLAGTDVAVLLNPIGSSPTIPTSENATFVGDVTVTEIVWPSFTTVPPVGDVIWRDTAAPTVKETELLSTPPTVTSTGPLVAPAGTEVLIFESLQPVIDAVVPLNVTALVP